MQNFKKDNPQMFRMMGDYYKLLEESHNEDGSVNWRGVLIGEQALSQKFLEKYDSDQSLELWQRLLCWEMVDALLKASRDAEKIQKEQEAENGKESKS